MRRCATCAVIFASLLLTLGCAPRPVPEIRIVDLDKQSGDISGPFFIRLTASQWKQAIAGAQPGSGPSDQSVPGSLIGFEMPGTRGDVLIVPDCGGVPGCKPSSKWLPGSKDRFFGCDCDLQPPPREEPKCRLLIRDRKFVCEREECQGQCMFIARQDCGMFRIYCECR